MNDSPTTTGAIHATTTATVEHVPFQPIHAGASSSLTGTPTPPEGESLRLEIDPGRLPPDGACLSHLPK